MKNYHSDWEAAVLKLLGSCNSAERCPKILHCCASVSDKYKLLNTSIFFHQ